MSKNDITGDNLKSKHTNEFYTKGWDLIWDKKSGSTYAPKDISVIIEDKLKEIESDKNKQ